MTYKKFMHSLLMTTDQAAEAMGCSRNTVIDVCKKNPGFGFQFARNYRIPRTHIERVMQGESPADVAASTKSEAR